MSRSSDWTPLNTQAEAHPWLNEKVYEPKRKRTIELVKKAVDSLVKRRERVSLTSVIAESKKIDIEERGVSKGGILGNPEAKIYYERYRSWKGSPRRKRASNRAESVAHVQRRIDPNRDIGRVRNRLNRKSKDELVDRVLELEQGYAFQEDQWLRLNDDLLQWRLRAEKAESMIEKMRHTLNAKDSLVQELQKKIDLVTSVSKL